MPRKYKNACCHYCRVSQNRSASGVLYISCQGCRNSYCSRCITRYHSIDFGIVLTNISTWRCQCCLKECCCCYEVCPNDSSSSHHHCFTYRRTLKRHKTKKPKWIKRKRVGGSHLRIINYLVPVTQSLQDSEENVKHNASETVGQYFEIIGVNVDISDKETSRVHYPNSSTNCNITNVSSNTDSILNPNSPYRDDISIRKQKNKLSPMYNTPYLELSLPPMEISPPSTLLHSKITSSTHTINSPYHPTTEISPNLVPISLLVNPTMPISTKKSNVQPPSVTRPTVSVTSPTLNENTSMKTADSMDVISYQNVQDASSLSINPITENTPDNNVEKSTDRKAKPMKNSIPVSTLLCDSNTVGPCNEVCNSLFPPCGEPNSSISVSPNFDTEKNKLMDIFKKPLLPTNEQFQSLSMLPSNFMSSESENCNITVRSKTGRKLLYADGTEHTKPTPSGIYDTNSPHNTRDHISAAGGLVLLESFKETMCVNDLTLDSRISSHNFVTSNPSTIYEKNRDREKINAAGSLLILDGSRDPNLSKLCKNNMECQNEYGPKDIFQTMCDGECSYNTMDCEYEQPLLVIPVARRPSRFCKILS